MKYFTNFEPDLLINDIKFPKYNIYYWCMMIRSHSNVPIIFLSSREHPTDIVMAMQFGADDYVQKPFHFDVLIAKIQAVLRRAYNYGTEQISMKTWRKATINFSKNTVTNHLV